MKDIVHIQLSISAGSTVDEAIDLAIGKLEMAKIVSFDFNGIKFAITESMKREDILKYWDMASLADKWYTRH